MLRGASSPAVSLLEAIERINPNFRVSFTPAVVRDGKEQRPALWWIHEQKQGTRADYLRREAGRYRLGRLWRRPRVELERRIATWWEAEYQAAGLYSIRSYTIAEWGEQAMLEQLRLAEAAYDVELKKARREQTREDLAAAEAENEMHDNPEFAGFVRDVAIDFYRNVSGGTLVAMGATTAKETASDEPNGQSVAGPGHGRDREPGQHSDGSAGQPEQGEVRSPGTGGLAGGSAVDAAERADGRGDADRG
jgi:hypothetical protein